MTSSSGKHRKKGSHSSSSSDDEGSPRKPPPVPTQPIYPSVPGYPPPPHGYPPQMGYNPYTPHPGYGQYPQYPGYGQYPPPPTEYYQASREQEDGIVACIRCIFMIIILFLLFSFISMILTIIFLRPQIPVFRVDAMAVSKFQATNTSPFTANWDANVTVVNPNTKLEVNFEQIKINIYYRNLFMYSLGKSYGTPFDMAIETTTTMPARVSTDGAGEGDSALVVDKIREQSKQGWVTFGMKLSISASLKSGWWKREVDLKVFCENLKVALVGNSGNGFLTPEKRDDCVVYI